MARFTEPKQLPDQLAIFPLTGALLLPGGTLPLNIFEPRYVAMTEDALAGDGLIGMIQPDGSRLPCGTPCVYPVGCAGEISEWQRTPDGRYLIVLSGLARFAVASELAPLRGYRQVQPDWTPYAADLQPEAAPPPATRTRLMPALRRYLAAQNLDCDWQSVENCDSARLISALAMVCPFSPAEKQALLEARDCAARAEVLALLIETAATKDRPAARH